MDLYRKISQYIENHLKRNNERILVVEGARQIGKSFIIRQVGRKLYENYIELNMEEDRLGNRIFSEARTVSDFYLALSVVAGSKMKEKGNTLVFIDEIQAYDHLLALLKFLQEDGRFTYIASGSLLGIALRQTSSLPMGSIEIKRMYPMDFEEFLMAVGETSLCDLFHQPDWELLNILRSKYIDLLRQYYYVGGMPEVVDTYVKNHDLQEVRVKQNEILNAYRRDISKHTTATESMRIGQVLQSLPSQLAKENKKFIYNVLKKGARAAKYELAIQWLIDAGIVHKVCRVKELQMPVKFYEDLGAFKLFLLDCGLLGCMTDAPASQMLVGNNIFREFKGSFTEQFVLQQLTAMGIPLYYWSSESTPAEIDFVRFIRNLE